MMKRLKSELKSDVNPASTWLDKVGLNSEGTRELQHVLGENIAIYPKPTSLIKALIAVSVSKDELVLDFFAGSGTTAQAVLELNKEDDGNRKFILIQLPESTDIKEYSTIAEITKERVRRVINKLNKEEAGQFPMYAKQDRGFRVFKLAESNFKTWEASAPKDSKSLEKQLELHIEHVREGRTSEDILYEILLKSGFALTTPVETLNIETLKVSPASQGHGMQKDPAGHDEGQPGKPLGSVYSIANGSMLVCLEKDLTLELIRLMADMKPQRVVCLDLGFAGNDQLKTNAVQIFKNKEIVFKTV
jgi:adenine-specific DNA-methyltransferase